MMRSVGLRVGAGVAGRLDPALTDILLNNGEDLASKLGLGPLVGRVGGDTGQAVLESGATGPAIRPVHARTTAVLEKTSAAWRVERFTSLPRERETAAS